MNIASPKQKKQYRFYNMTCNALEQPPQAKVERLNILVICPTAQKWACTKEAAENLTEREKGSFSF